MKNPIFSKSFEEIFTNERLRYESKGAFTLENFFDFAPHKTFHLPKDGGEFRSISVPDEKVKIIQKILADELSAHLRFSNRSYAYQKGKSPIKAINRVKHIVQNYDFVLKCDIDSFFDSIDHERLMSKLQNIVKDQKILYLIWLFLKNGALFQNEWIDKLEGIYQGDVLSPLLSNIYLHSFDISLEKRGVEFVRFADDLIFFTKTHKEAKKVLRFVKQRLAVEKQRLNEEKTYLVHKEQSFEYLGVRFHPQGRYSIDNDRLMAKISKISKETKKHNFLETVFKIKEFLDGFRNYYFQIVNDHRQFELLQNHIDHILIKKIIEAKKAKLVTKKRDFISHLAKLTPLQQIPGYAYTLVQRAYEELRLQDPKKAAIKKIEAKKRYYLKNRLKQTELIITQPGTSLGVRQGEIVLKLQGKVQKRFPLHHIKRIIITNTKTSLSTFLIYRCAQEKIDIDFIHKDEPFALLTYYKSIAKALHLKQLSLFTSPAALTYARALLLAKAKNQINLIKYFNRRRDEEKLSEYIHKMEILLPKLKDASEHKALMAYEANIAALYWNAFGIIAKLPTFQRTHKDSKDPINQALNYGYAILYNKIQSALIKEGLNLYYSFLHVTDHTKPTLVFDFIEPFRQPIVDREILSIITKRQKLTSMQGKLSAKSLKLVTQNVQERLASLTFTRYGKTTYLQLITFEANAFKRAVENQKPKHRFFIAKY